MHQTHGFLALLQALLRDELPDVFAALIDAGGTTMPMTTALGPPEPGDDDLRVLVVRRTTLEAVLRGAALREPGIELRCEARVVGLHGVAADGGSGARGSVAGSGPSVPCVTGVALADGSVIEADAVVVASGRRSPLPEWLAPLGVELSETVRPSGLMYLTRWYRIPADRAVVLDPKLGGDLGFVKFLGVPGDGATLSVTLAVNPDDAELRRALSGSDSFDLACRSLPGPNQFFAGGPLEPIGGVRPMAGLMNRWRRFTTSDGAPIVAGLHAVGDAHTCTNPLYGRGCSLAVLQAVRLRDAFAAWPDDALARARVYEDSCRQQVRPWYEVSVMMDRLGADPMGAAGLAGAGSEGADAKAMTAVMTAAATDPVLGRGFLRFWNLLVTPAELAADAAFVGRAMEVAAEPERWPLERPNGPDRAALLELLGVPS